MDFEEGQRSHGRLVLKDDPKMKPTEGKWELKSEFKSIGTLGSHQQTNFQCVLDVASFSNNEVVVADCGINQLTSSVMSKGLQIKGLLEPRCVSVNKYDQLIVLDNDAVKIFNRKHELLHQFTPSQRSHIKPTCIAVDDNSLIAVGYECMDQILLYNPDGSLIKTLYAPEIDHYMTIYKQNITYTNSGLMMLQSVDYNGRVLFSVDTTRYIDRKAQPRGVCCDRDGSIYVGVCMIGAGGGSIHHFSPNGKYIGCVIEDCGNYINGMTITPDGELVVAAPYYVKIFHSV